MSSAQPAMFVKDIHPGVQSARPAQFVGSSDSVYFVAADGKHGRELWFSDGTEAGTRLVKDINPGDSPSSIKHLTVIASRAFFSATNGINGNELWTTDGTEKGTHLVRDINPGKESSSPAGFIEFRGNLFFRANDVKNSVELWTSDGTESGTFLVKNIRPDGSSSPSELTLFKSELYFGVRGGELWKTDGTEEGTVFVSHPNTGNTNPPKDLIVSNGSLFFIVSRRASGMELWKSDGTDPGTVRVADLEPGQSGPAVRHMTEVNGTLFFVASSPGSGEELWKSDGTEAGTQEVENIRRGGASSRPTEFTASGGRLFFVANDGNGQKLWQSDGTEPGTFIKDAAGGRSTSGIRDLVDLNGTLLFTASEFGTGIELYKTTAEAPDVELLQDIHPGSPNGLPMGMTQSGSTVFLSAVGPNGAGEELWSLQVETLRFFSVSSTDAQNLLNWVSPLAGSSIEFRFRTDQFPLGPLDGTPLNVPEGRPGSPQSFLHSGLENGTTYYYSAFVDNMTTAVTRKTAKGRPESAGGAVQWVYNTGATSLAPPSVGAAIYVSSNDQILHGITKGPSGGSWPSDFTPFPLEAPSQHRPTSLEISVAGAKRVVFLTSQDGYVYAVNGDTGGELWRSPDLGSIQASPAGIFSIFPMGAYDLLLVGTRNTSGDNQFHALRIADGRIAWSFPSSEDDPAPGIVSGGAVVDYRSGCVFFTSRAAPGETQTLWAVAFDETDAKLIWSRGTQDARPIEESDVALATSFNSLYVATNDGLIHAVDMSAGADVWKEPFKQGDGLVKGYLFPNFAFRQIYFSTTNTLWSLQDEGASVKELWRTTDIPKPSTPLFTGQYLYVGGSDGRLYQINPFEGPTSMRSILLGDPNLPAAVGTPSLDVRNDLLYVGTESGAIYAVTTPFPP